MSAADKASASGEAGEDVVRAGMPRGISAERHAPSNPRRTSGDIMSTNLSNSGSPNVAPFVDQLPDGPGVSKIDPADPAAPLYQLLAKMRSPVALRDLMLHPVRTGYIGQETPIDPADLPKGAAELYPDVGVSEIAV